MFATSSTTAEPSATTAVQQQQQHAPVCSQAPLGADCCCCKFCEVAGCDVRAMPCKCCFHARCCPTQPDNLTTCPICNAPLQSLQLLPMSFDELDLARRQAECTEVSDKRGRKRKNKTIARLTGRCWDERTNGTSTTATTSTSTPRAEELLRTGRWTAEETEYCDALIVLFEQGSLPIADGLKLNEFLAHMLKSKQSRLTKKMKNAGLSTRQYAVQTGHVQDVTQARSFSQLESDFFASISCRMERAEIRFHMQKEWREHFSNYCYAVKQPLDANPWLYSVEELDRRAALQRDAERMTRRKVMMGQALTTDGPDCHARGVYIDQQPGGVNAQTAEATEEDEEPNAMRHYASPFVAKIMEIMTKHQFPFEHVDAWVPSYIEPGISNTGGSAGDQNCRLCFAGCGTMTRKVSPAGGGGTWTNLTDDEEFHLLSFGEYSQKFSFEVNCGLPGRVYNSGIASWEQGIQNAPLGKFERCGGAKQWGIQTVLGIPIASPTVGRVVVVFYSIYDRSRNLVLVNKIAGDLSKLRPSPKWKLVVDVGSGVPKTNDTSEEDMARQNYLLGLLEKFTPTDKSAPRADFLPGFTSLRLLLTRKKSSVKESELMRSTLSCFEAYRKAGRNELDSVVLTARDFMTLSKTPGAPKQENPHSQLVRQIAARPIAATAAPNSDIAQQLSTLHQNPQQLHQQQQRQFHFNTQQLHQHQLQLPQQAKATESNVTAVSYKERSVPIISAMHPTVTSLASLGGASPAMGSIGALPSLGTSPALQPINSQDMVAPFGLPPQFSSFLHFNETPSTTTTASATTATATTGTQFPNS